MHGMGEGKGKLTSKILGEPNQTFLWVVHDDDDYLSPLKRPNAQTTNHPNAQPPNCPTTQTTIGDDEWFGHLPTRVNGRK